MSMFLSMHTHFYPKSKPKSRIMRQEFIVVFNKGGDLSQSIR
jgi:hypothetical protein